MERLQSITYGNRAQYEAIVRLLEQYPEEIKHAAEDPNGPLQSIIQMYGATLPEGTLAERAEKMALLAAIRGVLKERVGVLIKSGDVVLYSAKQLSESFNPCEDVPGESGKKRYNIHFNYRNYSVIIKIRHSEMKKFRGFMLQLYPAGDMKTALNGGTGNFSKPDWFNRVRSGCDDRGELFKEYLNRLWTQGQQDGDDDIVRNILGCLNQSGIAGVTGGIMPGPPAAAGVGGGWVTVGAGPVAGGAAAPVAAPGLSPPPPPGLRLIKEGMCMRYSDLNRLGGKTFGSEEIQKYVELYVATQIGVQSHILFKPSKLLPPRQGKGVVPIDSIINKAIMVEIQPLTKVIHIKFSTDIKNYELKFMDLGDESENQRDANEWIQAFKVVGITVNSIDAQGNLVQLGGRKGEVRRMKKGTKKKNKKRKKRTRKRTKKTKPRT